MGFFRLDIFAFTKNILIIFTIVSFSFLLAISINSYIAIKSFTLPEEVKIKKSKYKELFKPYNNIAYLFKKIEIKPAIKTENKSIPEQNLETLPNIKLIGTLIFKGKKLALVKEENSEYLLKEGENFKGYKVLKIDKYFVKLEKNGKSYIINLDLSKKTLSFKSKNNLSQRKISNTYNQNSEIQTITLSKSLVEKETADIGNLLKDVRLIPVVKNGETVGFKFTYVNPRSILYKYGLRTGDFIKSINGMPVRTAEEAFKIYNMLRNENRVELEIERRGKRKVIVYEIQ